VSRLLVLGDLHCDRRHLRGLVERAVEERCDTLVSLGDLCYLPRDPEGRLRCLAYGGALPVRSPRAGRDWHRAAARERAALKYLAGGDEIDLLFCHDPRTLEPGARARGSFAALAAKLRPALVLYAHQHRPHVSVAGEPALVGLGSFRDGRDSAIVLNSAETSRLVRRLPHRQTATQPESSDPPASATSTPNKRHWITVTLDDSLPDDLLFGLIEDSYELGVDGLPKRERDLVRSQAP
jgi:hypothetical protein